jgi:putative hydrolase of the HAD superfamily
MSALSATAPALLIDFGGVLTESVLGAFERACRDHGVDPSGFATDAFSAEHGDDSPFALIELGHISVPEFVERIASVLSRHAAGNVDAAAWFEQVRQTTQRVDTAMIDAVRTLHRRGVQTVLLSNSWGPRDTYPWHALPDFSEVVVSAEVGIRKPSVAIYELAADMVGRAPTECLFVDDVAINLEPARRLGMATVLHERTSDTLAEFRRVYG